MMNYFSNKKKWLAYLVLLTFVFTCIVPTNIVGGNSAWAATEAEKSEQQTKQIAASGGVTENATDGVSISKTIAPTGIENYFDITLQVQAEETIKTLMQTQTTDVVIVLDISNTMNENNRLVNAKNAAKQFADYFYQALGTSGRLGIVTFNRDASVVHNFTDTQSYSAIATKIGSSSNEGIIAPSTMEIKWTNIEAGLKAGSQMLESSSAKHKYIILLTDGFPTTYIQSGLTGYTPLYVKTGAELQADGKYPDGVFYDIRKAKYCNEGNNYSDKGALRAQEMAAEIKGNAINIFSIGIDIANRSVQAEVDALPNASYSLVDCYTTSGDYVIGSATNQDAYRNWLGNIIAGGPDLAGEGKTRYSDGDNLEDLKAAYSGILAQIEEVNRQAVQDSWIAADPMGDNVEFLHFYDKSGNSAASLTNAGYTTAETSDDENEASYTDAINWNLMKSKYSSEKNGDKTIYTYELKYRVRLENEANDFSESTIYNANGTTTLKYKVNNNGILSAEKSLTFKMPKVKGHLGEFSFTKVDSLTQNPLEGAKFTLTHNVAECAVCKAAGNSVSIDSVTVTSNSDGMVSFTHIPSGHNYVLTEAKRDGYLENDKEYPITVAYGVTDDSSLLNGTSGKVISNEPEKTEVTVKKMWNDANNQDGKRPTELKVTLSNGTEVTLNEANNWTATVTNLPKYANGQEVVYTWTEGSMPEGYTLTDTSVKGTITTLTNSYTPELTSATVKKVWDDANNQDGKRPTELKVALSNGTEVTLNEANNWTATIENLPVYAGGQKITYTWAENEESMPEGYKLTNTSVNGTITTLTNSYTPETTQATVKKVWNDANNQDGKRPSELNVTLSNGTEVTLNEANNWTATIENLPVYAGGQKIIYTWAENEESMPEGYKLTNTSVNGTITTLTNSYTPETTQATVKKVWNDANNQDGKRPSELNVTLSNGTNGTEVTLNEGNSWTATIENLPKYANGQPITYTWTESAMPEGYTLTDTSVNGTITTLTNSYNVETIGLEIIKAWIGDENIADRRNDVQFTITGTVETENGTETVSSQTATATAQDGWSVKVENLPRYNDGKFITYTVSEDVPVGYTVSWDKNVVEAEALKNGDTVTVKATNTLQRAGILFVKDYVGGVFDTTVPDDTQAAQFKLKAEANAGSEEIILNRMGNTYSTTAGALQFGVMYTLSETVPEDTYVAMADRYLKLEADANGNLQVAEYDKDGKPVVNNNQNVIYPVQTEGYVKGYAQLEKIFNYPENATLKIFGQKSWVGGTTGSSIIVELFRNGITTGKTTKASVDFDWKYAFDGEFDRYDENGKPYIYTVVEHLIDGFTPYYGNTTDDNGNLVIDIVNVKNELSIEPYGDIWVEKQTNNDDYTSEYGFELWIQALKDESSNLNQEQQRDKTLLATALHSAKKVVEETAANIEPKTSMFEASAFATSGSQYRFFVTEADNCTTKLGVTTGSALEITGVNMRIAEDASYEGDWFVNAIESIKTLVAEMAEAFVSGGQARPNTEEMLTKIRDNVTVTSGSALAYSEEGLTGMFDALAAYKQARKDLTAAESAFAAFEASLSTPSSLILTVKGESPITLNPAEGTVVDGGKVFTVSGNSKVQTVYYYEDGKYYVVPFKLVKNERIDFHMEATTGSAIQYKVTEVDPQSANSTDLTIHFSADNKLTMANTLTSGIMDLTSGSAIGFEFYNKYVIGGNTGSDPVTKEETPETPTKEEKDPEESIPDENVPTGSVEPDEPLDELEDPEVPLGDAPATGDSANAVPFMALLAAAIGGLAITRRKFN